MIKINFFENLKIRILKINSNFNVRISNLDRTFTKGQSLVEIMVVIGLLAILLPALLTGIIASRGGEAQQFQRTDATALLKEGTEAVRNIKYNDWNSFASFAGGGPGYVQYNATAKNWELVAGTAPVINGFTRTVTVSDVNRDSSGNIAATGTNDPSTKKVVVTVSWITPYNSSISSTFFLSRLDNLSYTETTQTQFNNSNAIQTSVKVQAASAPNPTPTPDDGEIVLSQTGGFGDWCNPAPTPIAHVNLDGQGVPHAVSATQGSNNVIAAVAEGDNASGVTYGGINITDPTYPTPPVGTLVNTFTNTPKVKTNGIFNDTSYGYVAGAQHSNAGQGIIVNLGNYTKIAELDLNTNADGQSIYVLNNVAYLTASDSKIYTFDLNSPALSTCTSSLICHYSPKASVTLAGVGQKVIVVGNNAYIAVNSTSSQMQIVNVQNPFTNPLPNPTGITMTDNGGTTSNNRGGTDIYVNVPQSRAYMVTSANTAANEPEFFLINLNNNSILGRYDTHTAQNAAVDGDMSPSGVVAVSGAKVIIVGSGGKQYQAIKVDNESAPSYCGGLKFSNNIDGISTIFSSTSSRAYSYIINNDASAEFKIIEGGPGSSGAGDYVSTGTYLSQPLGPMTNNTLFNRFSATVYQPSVNIGTGFYGVKLQVAVADPDGTGSCTNSNYNFIGTDSAGTGTTHYFVYPTPGAGTLSGAIPLNSPVSNYKNPAKCFKYKVVLSTDTSTLTPIFKDITINYSP